MNEQKLIDDLNSALFSSPDAYSVLVEIREILGRHKAAASSAPQEVKQAEPVAWKSNFIKQVVLSVAEIPDRNSPEDQPEMMLVTCDELSSIVESAFEIYAPSAVQPQGDALDAARYHRVRKLNPRQFSTLWELNIAGKGAFDDLIDAIAQSEGKSS